MTLFAKVIWPTSPKKKWKKKNKSVWHAFAFVIVDVSMQLFPYIVCTIFHGCVYLPPY